MTDDEIVSLADELGIAYINEGNVINFARALLAASIADTATEPTDLLPNALWTRRGSGTDEWWSFKGYQARKDAADQWVLRKGGEELYRHTYLQVVMAHAERQILASAESIADTAGAKPVSAGQEQSLEAKVMEGFDVSKLKHEDGCRWWQDETFCTCGADQAELCRRWKSHALYWKNVASEYERMWAEESRQLLIANGCCERLMTACTDAGCPDGVRMDDWIRANPATPASSVADAAGASESNWAFEAAKINLDRIHAVVMEFGCGPQDTVVDWLRERLAVGNPVVWAVYCGLGTMRPISVHFQKKEALKVASEIKSNTEVRPLYAAPPDKKDTSEAERHHISFDDSLNKKLDAAESSDRRRFTCAARKQGTAGGNDAADCDYPSCGCDPNTDLETEIFMRKNYGWTKS